MNEKEELRKQIITEIKRIAKENNSLVVPRAAFRAKSKFSEWQLYKAFDSWNEAVRAAGFSPNVANKKKTDVELFEELHRVCKLLDAIPNMIQFRKESHDPSSYRKRWGRWNEVLTAFKDYLQKQYPDSKFIALLPNKSITKIDSSDIEDGKHHDYVWKGKKGIVYGPPIDFRGLRHEPVNEQGVVFLFGKISEELGFSIEAIRTNYPDCDGKRLIDKNKNLWEPVSIEFEYCSANFKEHGHDPSKCDVIICWIHDWENCPVEVIELKKVVKQLKEK